MEGQIPQGVVTAEQPRMGREGDIQMMQEDQRLKPERCVCVCVSGCLGYKIFKIRAYDGVTSARHHINPHHLYSPSVSMDTDTRAMVAGRTKR